MLYFGFLNNPPAFLESLPLNIQENPNQTHYMEAYYQRKEIKKGFAPIIHSLERATFQINPHSSIQAPSLREIDQLYSPESWKEGRVVNRLADICKAIKKIPRETLLYNNAGYAPKALAAQSHSGLSLLCEKMHIDPSQLTFEELIESLSASPHLLNPWISHLFLDRLHLMAALTDQSELTQVQTKEGTVSVGDIIIGLVNHISEKGLSEENAVAAEQLYIRITYLADQLRAEGKL